ncbi:filamin-C-like, partial [Pseudonaja textilis]|uniref:filamin-C-like n=1 Tax=Pseudonaja textilis TaxID=8673 RepID=UPI000EA897A2
AGAGDVGVVIVDPQGRRDTVEVVLEDKGDNIFRCTYRPVLEGPHTIYVTFAGAQIPKSPFTVNVAEAPPPAPPPAVSPIQIIPQSVCTPPADAKKMPPPTLPKPHKP